jgi:hypothetical protein
MRKLSAVLVGTLISVVPLMPMALAQPACVTQNMAVPPGANTSDKAAPFFIDTTGLDFKTAPPTRDPSNPNYPRATELPDGGAAAIRRRGGISSSARPMRLLPRPSRRMACHGARSRLSPCRQRTA